MDSQSESSKDRVLQQRRFAVEYGYDQATQTDFVANVSAVTLRVTFADGQGFISYSVVDAEPEGAGVPALPVVDIGGGDAFSVLAYGDQVPGGVATLPDDAIDYLGYVDTLEGTHVVMAFEIPGDVNEGGVDVIFPIGGGFTDHSDHGCRVRSA